ncbi:hypothetical protein HX096_12640 [Empedobacter falsenii]|uniref:hypothetical protein n=1 Tax=Empedobacter falsenii TaxID=343874 RepID=UPI002574A237|nr:hypothetical protein [Empedobacter falsenii]MDM1548701.1 hypothetical protein [Empedobacter falsenii]
MKSKATGIQYIDNQDQGELFDLKIEVVRDENGKILSGLVFGQTQPQNEASILIARKGEFKLNPLLGVGLGDALLSENMLEFRHRIRAQFSSDGLNIKDLNFYNLNNFSIDAEYE